VKVQKIKDGVVLTLTSDEARDVRMALLTEEAEDAGTAGITCGRLYNQMIEALDGKGGLKTKAEMEAGLGFPCTVEPGICVKRTRSRDRANSHATPATLQTAGHLPVYAPFEREIGA
jgi:hypothetical protein